MENKWKCPYCNETFATRAKMFEHRKSVHKVNTTNIRITKDCIYCGRHFENVTSGGYKYHENSCELNPNRVQRVGHKHTEAEKKHLSECAKRNNLGGWHTSKSYDYNGIKLDSSYELAFVQDLDKNNIKWERPKPLMWEKDGNTHRYYPDFFLPEYDIFVDTKNDYLINCINPRFGITDVEKIHLVEQQNNVKIYILDKNNLLWSSLAGLTERLNVPDL